MLSGYWVPGYITEPSPPPQVWVSGFLSVNGNRISALAIMKKLKNGCHFIYINHMENFQITDLSQSLGLWFSECYWKQNISIGHYDKIEKWLPFCKYRSYGNISNYPTSHPCVVLHFLILFSFEEFLQKKCELMDLHFCICYTGKLFL